MIVQDYAEFIEDNSVLTRLTDLFETTFPDDTATGVLIESGGDVPQEQYMDIRKAILRITSIHKSSTQAAYDQIMLVFNLLQHNQNLALTNYLVYYLDGTGVVDIERDAEGRPRFQFSATVTYRPLLNVIS